MSRLTATQVITLGEYLEPNFDPTSLTISQLLGVLGYHNVQYPTPYSKAKLVQVFNDEIKNKGAKLRKERLKRHNSIPSDDGITDGVTGRPVTKRPAPRRSTRRSSVAPIDIEDDDDEPAPPPDPSKRRRSSAQPTLGGGTSRRKAPVQATLAEESEPEEDEVRPPPRKIVKKKNSEASRRISESFGEDSGWEDNNVFQSGAESSSPIRPSPTRPKAPRKSGTVVRKTRKSMSAPPQSSPTRSSPFSPPQSTFNPKFERPPPLMFPSPSQRSRPAPVPSSPFHFDFDGVKSQDSSFAEEYRDYLVPIKQEEEEEEYEEKPPEVEATLEPLPEAPLEPAVSEDGEQSIADSDLTTVADVPESSSSSMVIRILSLMPVILFGVFIWGYKVESAAIGFCDTNSRTNNALEDARGYRAAVESCNRQNRTELYLPSLRGSDPNQTAIPCPLPPLIPFPHPDACTACPRQGTCTQFSVQCDNGYLLKPHPLLALLPDPPQSYNLSISSSSTPSEIVWTILSSGLNGLPGLGPIALPPRCVLDPRRQRNIGALGKAMESLLAQEKGMRMCIGGKQLDEEIPDGHGGDARKWGIELETLRENMKRKTSVRLKPAFDDTFNEAVQELIQWGGILLGSDQEGRRYLASKDADLTWDCMITIKSRELWAAWRTTALGAVLAIFLGLVTRFRAIQNKSEARRVSELVQIALDTLRNQELAHHTDPVTTPHPYLSSIQLRDLILQNEHSIPMRRRVWDQVEHVVEGNANVRANLEEIEGGDELRVWRWVGSTGRRLVP